LICLVLPKTQLFSDKKVGDVYGRKFISKHDLRVVLVNPEIPQNAGNIGRLCVGFGASLHLVHPLGFKTDAAQLKRAGLDYWENLAVYEHASLDAFFEEFPQAAEKGWALTTKVKRPFTSAEFAAGDFLFFGPETKGLSSEFFKKCGDRCLTIPIMGPIRSYNLANSVSIALFEAARKVQPEAFEWKK